MLETYAEIDKTETDIDNFANFLLSPKTILGISGIYLIGHMIFIKVEGDTFLHFGPGDASFIGIKLDSWQRVILMYAVSFLSSVINTHAVSKNQFIMQVLAITQFFTILTMQLQFIIPQIIGFIII
jgi:hypothetical protein